MVWLIKQVVEELSIRCGPLAVCGGASSAERIVPSGLFCHVPFISLRRLYLCLHGSQSWVSSLVRSRLRDLRVASSLSERPSSVCNRIVRLVVTALPSCNEKRPGPWVMVVME